MPTVAIIGGGSGGLMSAYLLERKSTKKFEVTLFEASDRVGGKIVTQQFDAAPIQYEAGVAELYDYSQLGSDPLRRLVKTLGLPIHKMYGQTVVLDDRILRDDGDIKRHFGKKTLRALQNFRRRCSKLITLQDYYDGGWPDDNHKPLIQRSFQSVLAEVPNKTARRILQVAVHSDLATEPHLTHGLYGVENCLMDAPGYIRLYSIDGGIEQLPLALKQKISAHIQLNCPVVQVEKTSNQTYRVFFRNRGNIESNVFDAVVVALPNYWIPTIKWGGKRLAEAMQHHHAYYDRPAHYLRICMLFQTPFWRQRIGDSYFHLDAFGGCCLYDESSRFNSQGYGVLSWLLGGNDALVMSNFEDHKLVEKALEALPKPIAQGKYQFLEGRVHRWVGAVNAQPAGYPIKGPKVRHRPEPKDHPGLFVVGDYLFDSTINGALDSADIATDLLLSQLKNRKSCPELVTSKIHYPKLQTYQAL
jgi:protoporphyrinogen oxidase